MAVQAHDSIQLRPDDEAVVGRSSVPWRPMRIAMVGQRGVPASFGGIERHVEEIGARLADRGHDVTVYCRSNYAEVGTQHRGMQVRSVPTLETKHFEAIAHSALSTAIAMRQHPDVVHFHALGPGLIAPLPRWLSRAKVVQTIHGLDHQRGKWGGGAQRILQLGGWMSARVPDLTIVVSTALQRHYLETYGRPTTYITNGAPAIVQRPPAGDLLEELGLRAGTYALFVGRLVPEKAPDLLLDAFARLQGPTRLVIAGGSSYSDEYVDDLRRRAGADHRVVMAGYRYGRDLAELYANAGAFVLPSKLEGLPLTLLEAASYGLPILASDIEPHREVIRVDRHGSRLFESGDVSALTAGLERIFGDLEAERVGACQVRNEVLAVHDWDDIALQTESAYLGLLAESSRESLAGNSRRAS